MLLPPLFIRVIRTQQIKYEEEALEKCFGEEYLDYKRKGEKVAIAQHAGIATLVS